MNLQVFNNLDITAKGEITFGEGSTFLGFRIYYGQKLVLYSYDDFFIEVYYDTETSEINKIDAFDNEDIRLDRYIDFMTGYQKNNSILD